MGTSKHVGVLTVYEMLFIYIYCPCVGLDNKRYEMHSTYIENHINVSLFNSPNLVPRLIMSGDIPPLPNMSLRHAQEQRYFHLHCLMQYYANSVASDIS